MLPTLRLPLLASNLRKISTSSVQLFPKVYAKSHEWADIQGDKATLGISEFAQKELGDVVFVDLPEVGAKLEAGASFGAVESVKVTDEIYTPVSGTVVEVNTALVDQPELVNKEAEKGGWMVKLSGVPSDIPDGLMNKEAYDQLNSVLAHSFTFLALWRP